jgi:uncharacterized membrane protein YfcA
VVSQLPAAALVAFAVALVTTPAGVSGAVFLLPVQLGVLGVPSPAATPTNLLYNVVATPGGLIRWVREGRLDRALTATLVLASVPGVVAGALLRVHLLSGRTAVLLLVGVVLLTVGVSLVAVRPRAGRREPRRWVVRAIALAAGVVGGAYGIGGGSMVAPALALLGMPVSRVAPAAVATTLATSVAGIAAFEAIAVLSGTGDPIGPDWPVGVALGAGGLAGAYTGARLSGRRLPERGLRLGLGCLAAAVGAAHLITAAVTG